MAAPPAGVSEAILGFMRRSTFWLAVGSAAGTTAALASAYGLILRPWHLRWGARAEELTRPLPLDSLVDHPNYFTTRAITIAAPPEKVWPHVIDAAHLPHHTAIRTTSPPDYVAFAPPEAEAESTWVVVLQEESGGTRLISRNRARFRANTRSIFRYALVDPGQFVFERAWLREVKRRAEES